MKYVLIISVLMWYSLHRSQAAGEQNPRADREERSGEQNPRAGREERSGEQKPMAGREERSGEQNPRAGRKERFGEQNPRAGREERFGEEYLSHGKSEDAICRDETIPDLLQCGRDIRLLAAYGFPWSMASMSETKNQLRNQQMEPGNFRDSLDLINHMCKVFDDFSRCLDQHAIPTECLVSYLPEMFKYHAVFQFVCHMQPRSSDLLRSLQCLKETRVVDLLYYGTFTVIFRVLLF